MEREEFLQLNPEEQADIVKRRYHALIHGGPHSVEEMAGLLGAKKYNLYRYCDADLTTHHAPHQDIIKASLLQHNFDYFDFLEAMAGRVAFPIPRAAATPAEIYREIGKTTRAVGELLTVLTGSLEEDSSGGQGITHQEFMEIQIACQQAHARLAALEQAARLAQGGRKVVKGEEFPVRFGGKVEK